MQLKEAIKELEKMQSYLQVQSASARSPKKESARKSSEALACALKLMYREDLTPRDGPSQ